ncbi:MAG: RES family NAD+ phosphorylase [Blastocatellia bacterium]
MKGGRKRFGTRWDELRREFIADAPASLSQKIQEALPLATEFEGVCVRIVNTQRAKSGEALSTEGSRIHGGRYNSRDEFGVLYLSCDEPTCLAEINYYLNKYGIDPASLSPEAKTMVDVSVKLTKVLDLTDPDVRLAIGVTEPDLKVEWEDVKRAGDEAITQSIGRLAREAGFEAIIVPSARHSGNNLVILNPDNLSAPAQLLVADQRTPQLGG